MQYLFLLATSIQNRLDITTAAEIARAEIVGSGIRVITCFMPSSVLSWRCEHVSIRRHAAHKRIGHRSHRHRFIFSSGAGEIFSVHLSSRCPVTIGYRNCGGGFGVHHLAGIPVKKT
jgi:hypothetical protein